MSLGSSTNFFLGAGGAAPAPAGYQIERSLRFNRSDSGAYLNRTPSTAGNRRTWTISVWCKKTANGVYMPLINANNSTNPYLNIAFTNTDQIRWLDGSNQGQVLTDAVFRDNSAWYHIVCAVDTTQSTATDRVKIYVNGVRQDVTFPTTVTQNHQTQVNATTEHRIGRWLGTSTNYLDGYLAEYILIDGQALAPTDFAEFDANGVWQPKAYAGSYGTNGFKLNFSDNSSDAALGTDSSGNNNDWTVNNLNASEASTTAITSLKFLQAGGGSVYLFKIGTTTVTSSVYSTVTNNITQYDTGNTSADVPNMTDGDDTTFLSWKSGSMDFTFDGSLSAGYIEFVGAMTNNAYIQVNGGTQYPTANAPIVGTTSGGVNIRRIALTPASDVDSLFDSPTNGTQTDTGLGGEVSGNYATLNPLAISPNVTPTLSNGNLEIERTATSSEWTSC